jgi:hypothetical protein
MLIVMISFAAGAAFGVLLQTYYGAGRALRRVGVLPPLPTVAPQPTPTAIPLGVDEALQGRLALFILAGQSNMSGRAELPQNQALDPQILVFGNDYRWRIAVEPLDSPEEQVDVVSADLADDPARFGPGLAFARKLRLERPTMAIGLIPCAKGATTIQQWQRNLDDSTLYGSCLKRVRAASVMGQIAGMLFFQGESDAIDPVRLPNQVRSASDYDSKFVTFVQDMRADVLQPSLPVVFAQIGTNRDPQTYTNWDVVKQQQTSVKLDCASMIAADDLELRDLVHYTTASYRVIGERFAHAFLQLSGTPACQ